METRLENAPGLLTARLSGEYSLAAAVQALDRVASVAKARSQNRVLIDMRALSGESHDVDRYELGRHAAQVLSGVDRLAVVVGTVFSHNGFAAEVARNRGLELRVFAEEEKALAWLAG